MSSHVTREMKPGWVELLIASLQEQIQGKHTKCKSSQAITVAGSWRTVTGSVCPMCIEVVLEHHLLHCQSQ